MSASREELEERVEEQIAEPEEPLEWSPPEPVEQSWQELEGRPYPGELSTETLQEEFCELSSAVYETQDPEKMLDPDQEDAAYGRMSKVWTFLEQRLEVEYPECECGISTAWGQSPGEALRCLDCGRAPDEEIRERVHAEWRRLRGDD